MKKPLIPLIANPSDPNINPLNRLAIHTITNRPWKADVCLKKYADCGVGGVTFWRRDFEFHSPADLGRRAGDLGLTVVSLARGGFFPARQPGKRREAVADNLQAIDEAAELGAPSLVLVCGADPAQPLDDSRSQIRDGIAACLDHAAAAGVVLAIEPLHPMYADVRSAINTMAQANALCAALGNHPNVGIACDVYHTWWDPGLEGQIQTAADHGDLTAYHVCDWITPTTDLLNDRGLMGEGCIDVPSISGWIDAAGFTGFREVEIFSTRHWSRNQDDFLRDIINAYQSTTP